MCVLSALFAGGQLLCRRSTTYTAKPAAGNTASVLYRIRPAARMPRDRKNWAPTTGAASAEAVITGRLGSGVNGIIGVQILLKKRKLDQPKKKCPYSLMTLPLFWMTGWGSVSIGGAGSAERAPGPSITLGEARSDVLGDLRGDPVVLVRVHNVAACDCCVALVGRSAPDAIRAPLQ